MLMEALTRPFLDRLWTIGRAAGLSPCKVTGRFWPQDISTPSIGITFTGRGDASAAATRMAHPTKHLMQVSLVDGTTLFRSWKAFLSCRMERYWLPDRF